MQLSKKKKVALHVFSIFWNLDWILNIYKKNMTLIGDVFLNLRTSENLVR